MPSFHALGKDHSSEPVRGFLLIENYSKKEKKHRGFPLS